MNTQQHLAKLLDLIPGSGQLSDFRIYERALQLVLQGESPYFIYNIGAGFLYPPPSLFLIEPFLYIQEPTVKFFTLIIINIGIIIFIFGKLSRLYSIGRNVLLFLRAVGMLPVLAFLPALGLNYVSRLTLYVFTYIYLCAVFGINLHWANQYDHPTRYFSYVLL